MASNTCTSARRQPRRIVFFDHTARMGGGEISLLNLVVHLDARRFLPIVIIGEDGPLVDRLRKAKIETYILPMDSALSSTRKDTLTGPGALQLAKLWNAARYVFRLTRLLRYHRADLLHTNSLKADILGALAARLAGIPVIWHVRDRIADDYLPVAATRGFRFLCRFAPSYIVTNSSATLDSLSLPAMARARVVYNGIVESKMNDGKRWVVHDGFVEPPTDTQMESGNRQTLGMVGRISPWKGQHIFIEAAARVHKQFPAAKFQIIGAPLFGEAEYETQLHRQVEELGLSSVVEFTGFRSDVPYLVQNLTVLVHASTSGEPFGQVVIEGMAAGKPIIATDGGGIPEIVVDGATGLLVPMANADAMATAMIELLRDPQRAHQMGCAGRRRVEENFTIAQTAAKVQSLYEDIEGDVTPRRDPWLPVLAVLAGLVLGKILFQCRDASGARSKRKEA